MVKKLMTEAAKKVYPYSYLFSKEAANQKLQPAAFRLSIDMFEMILEYEHGGCADIETLFEKIHEEVINKQPDTKEEMFITLRNIAMDILLYFNTMEEQRNENVDGATKNSLS